MRRIVLAALAVGVGVSTGSLRAQRAASDMMVGDRVPDVTALDAAGEAFPLREKLAGHHCDALIHYS